ncbi:MAG: biopolymer transporter ExbD [Deltaproteobacteria bacterium]|nr:biopolymer transporter ExbD [Deltaproteobacteria bacterium]
MSGINVTPLVDVVLVLLIIFLITAPVIYQNAIKVQLPQAKSGEDASKPNPLTFVINKEGELFWNDQKMDWDALPARLQSYLRLGSNEGATVTADKATPHGTVVRLMDVLRQSGIVKFSLTVESKR